MPVEKLRWIVLSSLMAALTAVGAYIHVPIGPVPIVLSTLFAILSGLLLGSRWGLASMGLYLLVGAIGLPVFAGGKGGFAHFFGPTGGYLFGFALASWITGFISERSPGSLILDVFAVIIGSLAIYGLGVPGLKWSPKCRGRRHSWWAWSHFLLEMRLKPVWLSFLRGLSGLF